MFNALHFQSPLAYSGLVRFFATLADFNFFTFGFSFSGLWGVFIAPLRAASKRF
jgi:hypothetical protein